MPMKFIRQQLFNFPATLQRKRRLQSKVYGPGLFESVYEEICCYEFEKEELLFERQKSIPLVHELVKLEAGFRADVIIENKLLIEFKSLKN